MTESIADHSARCTIVVIPRERFSESVSCLNHLYENTAGPFELIYVDGGSPRNVARGLAREGARRGFRLIRTERYLSPNEARNIGFSKVETPYVVFIDNDVLVAPGWLDALVRCADEAGAWVVGPLYCAGRPEHQTIHMAGGRAAIDERDGRRHLREAHGFIDRPVAEVRPQLRREPTELVEFHCMLVRTEALRRLGLLDENLISTSEHLDFCMTAREAGGTVYFEPASIVTYLIPPPFAWSDVRYYLLRWSDRWNNASMRHMREKWRLADDDPWLRQHQHWLTEHRRLALRPLRDALQVVAGWRRGRWIERAIEGAVTPRDDREIPA